MDEGATVVVGVTSPSTARRLAMLGFAVAAWLVGFAILLRLGTWTPFALTGPALAALALWSDATTRALLRPSFRKAGVGLAAGLLMVVLTHAAFAFVAPLLSEARTATARLFELLNVSGFSPAARVGFIVAIASSEEVIFRGALMGPPRDGKKVCSTERIEMICSASLPWQWVTPWPWRRSKAVF